MLLKKINTFSYKTSREKSGSGSSPETNLDEKEKKEDVVLCRQCLLVITLKSNEISVNGSHSHTFANPGGLVYDIGCYQSAKGCLYIGNPTDEFSWFKGFQWRVAICGSCHTHLGWLFISSGNSFHGLILERLIE